MNRTGTRGEAYGKEEKKKKGSRMQRKKKYLTGPIQQW